MRAQAGFFMVFNRAGKASKISGTANTRKRFVTILNIDFSPFFARNIAWPGFQTGPKSC